MDLGADGASFAISGVRTTFVHTLGSDRIGCLTRLLCEEQKLA